MRDNSGKAGRRIMRRKSTAFGAAIASPRASTRSALGWVRPGTSGLLRRPVLAARFSTLCALGCAMAVSGCAPGSVQSESRPDPMHAAATPLTSSEAHMCRPDRALFAPQPAPDCGFGRSNLKTLDPDRWARLKLEYERRCYKNAEKIVRERLRLLQAAIRCEAEPARK